MANQKIVSCSLNYERESDLITFFAEYKQQHHLTDSALIKEALRSLMKGGRIPVSPATPFDPLSSTGQKASPASLNNAILNTLRVTEQL